MNDLEKQINLALDPGFLKGDNACKSSTIMSVNLDRKRVISLLNECDSIWHPGWDLKFPDLASAQKKKAIEYEKVFPGKFLYMTYEFKSLGRKYRTIIRFSPLVQRVPGDKILYTDSMPPSIEKLLKKGDFNPIDNRYEYMSFVAKVVDTYVYVPGFTKKDRGVWEKEKVTDTQTYSLGYVSNHTIEIYHWDNFGNRKETRLKHSGFVYYWFSECKVNQ